MIADDDPKPLVVHLVELRKRLIRVLIALLAIFIALVSYANEIYHLLSVPLIKKMPAGAGMIATDVASPFLTPIKLTFAVSVFLSAPIILSQLWGFVAPGLYRHEKRLLTVLLVSSSILFYLGVAFAYFFVFPMIFGFFTQIAPQDVTIATDITRYLDFVIALLLAFGTAFEVPVAIFLLCRMKITTPGKLKKKRRHILVGAFIVGMLLTPPDVFSQTLLAIPLYILFELGLFCSDLYLKRTSKKSIEIKNSS